MVNIYKLVCDQTELVYVGRTKSTLATRFSHHKWNYSADGTCSSKILFGMGDITIHLLETCSEANMKEREAYWYEQLPCMNAYVPNRSKKENNRITNPKRKGVTVKCEFCGCLKSYTNLRTHQKTKKCKNDWYMNTGKF